MARRSSARPIPIPGRLAGLGLGIGGRGRLRGGADARVRPGGARLVCPGRPRRHVLGAHQPPQDRHPAVALDGDDAPGHRAVLGRVQRPVLDRGLDLGDALGEPALLPRLAVGVLLRQLVEPGFEAVQLRALGLGRPRGRGVHPPEARGGAPVGVEHRLGPPPVGRELVRGHAKAPHGEIGEEVGVLEPHPLAVAREEVAVERAARGLVCLGAHEAGEGGGPRRPALGEHPAHRSGLGPAVPRAQLLVDRHLPRGVGGGRERLQGVEVEHALAAGVEQRRGGVAEAKAARDRALGDAEPHGDGRGGGAPGGEPPERLHLVGGVHGHAHHVLGERELRGRGVARVHAAGHGMARGQRALVHERLQGREPAPARDDRVARSPLDRAHHEAADQAVGGDGRLELGEGRRIGRGLSHVLGRGLQGIERERADGAGRVVHGGSPSAVTAPGRGRGRWNGAKPPRGTGHGLLGGAPRLHGGDGWPRTPAGVRAPGTAATVGGATSRCRGARPRAPAGVRRAPAPSYTTAPGRAAAPRGSGRTPCR